jgi:hypothetical protein
MIAAEPVFLATNAPAHRWFDLRLNNGELSMTNQNNPGQQNQNPGQKPGQQQGGGQKPGQQQQDPGREKPNPNRQGQQIPGQDR